MLQSQNLIPLMGGAYQARSKIADYQLCENLFPEINPQEQQSPVPITHYPREGKRPLSVCPNPAFGRGIFTASNGQLFAIVGATVYAIGTDFSFNALGQIAALDTPVSIADNGITAVLVDGTPSGYTITLAGNVFAPLVDPVGLFSGSRRVDFADTFLAFAQPNTNSWYVSNSNTVTFTELAQANKDSTPDDIVTFAFNLRNAFLLGARHSEIWYLSGGTPFPYQAWPNVFIPYGCAAPYSLVRADIDLFWLSNNDQGQAIALKTNGMDSPIAISTRALEAEWSTYRTIADVIGGCFQQAGHTFIIFHFPSADRTWAYDLATKQWHRRTYVDSNGLVHREKTAFYASVNADGGYNPTIVGQDWQTGQLYALDPDFFSDNGQPIVCRRTFPHQMADMKEVTHVSFVADFETGGIPDTAEGNSNTPMLSMRYSNDGGGTFGNYRQKALASAGHYRTMMRWRGLGMARDRVYELSWSFNGPSALNGAYLEPMMHSS